jgi:hypothetical protein
MSPMKTALVSGAVVGALTILVIVGSLVFGYPRWVPFLAVVLMTPIFLTTLLLAKERQSERGKSRAADQNSTL